MGNYTLRASDWGFTNAGAFAFGSGASFGVYQFNFTSNQARFTTADPLIFTFVGIGIGVGVGLSNAAEIADCARHVRLAVQSFEDALNTGRATLVPSVNLLTIRIHCDNAFSAEDLGGSLGVVSAASAGAGGGANGVLVEGYNLSQGYLFTTGSVDLGVTVGANANALIGVFVENHRSRLYRPGINHGPLTMTRRPGR